MEANLGMIRNSGLKADLVRRRSGGGTVFHDKGNVNYSVICPTPDFNRDKHAEMVVRALKTLNLEKARVNERHDIVYDKAVISEDSKDTSRNEKSLVEKTFKISGSAYKLTRLRSLHHGTCIAWSQNINAFSRYLRSPTRGLIVARGVESVRSPVTNVERKPEQVEQAVVSEFSTMYNAGEPVVVTGAEMAVPEIAAGVKELKASRRSCWLPNLIGIVPGLDLWPDTTVYFLLRRYRQYMGFASKGLITIHMRVSVVNARSSSKPLSLLGTV